MTQGWEPGTQYNNNDVVEYQGNRYKIIQPHRSQGDWTPDVTPALWGKIPGGGGGDSSHCHPQQEHRQPQQHCDPPKYGSGHQDEHKYEHRDEHKYEHRDEHKYEHRDEHKDEDKSTQGKVKIGGALAAGIAVGVAGGAALGYAAVHKGRKGKDGSGSGSGSDSD